MRAINRILCPVDLSDITNHGANHAALLAGWYHARITALHVCNPVAVHTADFATVGPAAAPVLTDEEIAERRQQVASAFDAAGARGADVIIETGTPAARILECAASLPADLIVIGTHGEGGFQHLVLGSVAEKVLRQAACPVLTVPPRARTTSTLPFRRLLCPVDFSESSLAALEAAVALAREGDGELTILHVFEWSADGEALIYRPMNVPEFRLQVEQDAADRLQALLPGLGAGARAKIRLGHGKSYREILGVATEESADLIIMGVHGRNAIDLMLFGSTTNQVVRRATCPVLTLRG